MKTFKAVLKALLGILVVFALLIIYILINNINVGYFILFVPFVALFLWLVLYLLNRLFKKFNKQEWFFAGVAVLYIYMNLAAGFGNVDVFLTNIFNFRPLSSHYKTYHEVNQPTIRFGNKEMKLLATSDFKLEHCITANNYLIIRKDNRTYYNEGDFGKDSLQKPIEHLFYKYDTDGYLIDNYKFIQYIDGDKEELIEGYLINATQKYYKTWGLNGDMIKREVKELNQDLSWNKDKEDAMLQNIINNADIYYHHNEKVVFRQNKEWTILSINQIYHYTPLRYYKNGKSNLRNNVFKYSVGHVHNETAYFDDNIEYKYFQKNKFIRPKGKNKSDYDDRWFGNLYSDIIIGNDTLKLKQSLYLSMIARHPLNVAGKEMGDFFTKEYFTSSEGSRYYDFDGYNYYENQNLSYQLFSSSWSSHSKPNNIYMIKSIE